jgi:parallel beta-helix repeat protein
MKRLLSIGIILLFIGMSIQSSTGFNVREQSIKTLNGNTLYVGGSGPGNYTKIQDAINDSRDGDIVFVYNGTYYENVVVNKSINLVGENRNTTVIDGGGNDSVILIDNYGFYITINGFTIQNSGTDDESHSGIQIEYRSAEIYIFNNIIMSNNNGVYLFCTVLCTIKNNIITSNENGISCGGWRMVGESYETTISNNIISNNRYGIHCYMYFSYNNISNNIISNNRCGIWFGYSCYENMCIRNNISNNKRGILSTPCGNIVKKNNFIKNNRNAKQFITAFHGWIDEGIPDCIFDGNYWGKARYFPYPIPKKFGFIFSNFHTFPLWDMNPAQEPYDIEV